MRIEGWRRARRNDDLSNTAIVQPSTRIYSERPRFLQREVFSVHNKKRSVIIRYVRYYFS